MMLFNHHDTENYHHHPYYYGGTGGGGPLYYGPVEPPQSPKFNVTLWQPWLQDSKTCYYLQLVCNRNKL